MAMKNKKKTRHIVEGVLRLRLLHATWIFLFAALISLVQTIVLAADSAPVISSETSPSGTELQQAIPSSTFQARRIRISQTELRFEPLIRSQQDLAGLLTGQPLGKQITAQSIERLMQAVPGIDPAGRYGGAEYGEIRDAFSITCINSARGYRSGSQLLFQSLTPGSSPASGSFTSNFDSECLTPLDNIPVQLRRVIGILLDKDGKVFCSATVLDIRTILTSRHCFVRADGAEEPTHEQLFNEQVTFQTAEPHNGRSDFTIAAPDATAVPLVDFQASDDYLVLRVKSWDLQYHVEIAATRLPAGRTPTPAWIIGSNPTVTDVGQARKAMDFTRGSQPRACAILEVTTAGCIYHSCQTGPATSGAGVLTFDRDRPSDPVRLLGVHKGPVASAKNCEAAPPFELKVNLASGIGAADLFRK
jgi:hypothetical protein